MDVRTVAVIGAGTMGAGIAQVCAQTGWQTRLYDAFPEGLEKGMNTIVNFWDKGISRGKTTEEEKAKWSANITQSTDLKESVEDVDLVIEAVPENMDLKQQIFSQLEEMAPPHAILATNTSGLPISAIAESTNCPERIIGMHFFNPVPIMKLLEIVRHDSCSRETIAAVQSIGSSMGKETIIVNDVPGFATSRLGVILGNEAIRMLADGVASSSRPMKVLEPSLRRYRPKQYSTMRSSVPCGSTRGICDHLSHLGRVEVLQCGQVSRSKSVRPPACRQS